MSGSAAAAAALPGMSNMVLNGHLALAAGHPMWPQGYFGHPGSSLESSGGAHLPSSSHMGPLFAPRATHRYSPYQLPLTKTTMVTTSTPLPATGVTSPMTSTEHSLRTASPSPVKSHGTISPVRGATPPRTVPTQRSGNATSELKNIERMVNGLERQQEQLAAECLSKLGDK